VDQKLNQIFIKHIVFMTCLDKNYQTKLHMKCHLFPLQYIWKDIYIYLGRKKFQVPQIKVEEKDGFEV
jgi:hypothetical protein